MQMRPVNANITVRSDVLQQSFANRDIIWRGIIVQLLVPFFHHSTLAIILLLHSKNFITNALANVACSSSANRRHDETNDISILGILTINSTQTFSHSRLSYADFPGLDVVIVVPNKLSQSHKAEPAKHCDEPSFSFTMGCRQHIGTSIVTMHERPRRTLFSVADHVHNILCHVTTQVLERAGV